MNTTTIKIQMTGLLFVILFVTCSIFAQVPNNSFENWSGNSLDSWNFGYSDPGYENVFQSTDATEGNYSVRLKPVYNNLEGNVPRAAINTGMFPLTTAYESLSGDIKGTLAGGDDFVITVDLFKDGTTLAVGSYSTSQSSSEWSSFTAPINYGFTDVPDSAWINVLVTNGTTATEGTDYLVDNLHFEGSSSINDLQEPADLSLYPNPAIDRFSLSFTLNQADQLTFFILNLSGQTQSTIKSQLLQSGPNNISISTTDLTPGVYLLKAVGNQTAFVKEIVVGK